MRRILLTVAFGLGSCNLGPPPQSVTPDVPEVITSTDPVLVAVKVRDDSGNSSVDKGPFEVSIAPPGIAEVDKNASLHCLKNGDAKLSVGVKGVTGIAAVKCRLVNRLEVQKPERIDIAKGSFVLSVKALAKDGTEVTDVPITITPTKPKPLKVKGIEITPVEVGETELAVRAGKAEQTFPVKVVRGMNVEALPMQAGHRVNFSLPEGKFEIRVTLNGSHPLAIEWRGAPYCDYKGQSATLHVSTCVLQNKGGVVTDNPHFADSGSTEVNKDGIELFEVP